jgi:hypothetical protein
MAAENQPYDPDERDDLAVLDFTHPTDYEVDEVPVPVFTVANPPGTVSVTTFMDGRVKNIELSSRTTELTEYELADEIVVIAGLATQQAKSAQYAFMLEGMREQGNDDAATRDFLARDLDLPTPEEAQAAKAHIFATRYASEHD